MAIGTAPARLRSSASAVLAAVVLVAAAAVSIPVVADRPILLVGLMGLAVAVPLALRMPVAALVAGVALTAFYGTLRAYGLPAADGLDLVLLALWGAAAVVVAGIGARTPALLWPGCVLLVAYLLLTLVQVLTADDVTTAVRGAHTVPWFLATLLLVAYAPWPDGARERVVRGIVVVAGLVALYALFRLAVGPSERELLGVIRRPDLGTFKNVDPALFGSFGGQKELAGWCVVAVPVCLAAALFGEGLRRLAAAGVAVGLVVAIVASETRTAIVAVAVAALLVLAVFAVARSVASRGPVLVAAILAIGLAAPAAILAGSGGDRADRGRLAEVLDPTSASTFKERQRRWADVFAQVGERPLGTGLGTAGGVARLRSTDIDALSRTTIDSSYVQLLVEQGWVAYLAGAALLALLAQLVLSAGRTTDPGRALLGASGAGALGGMLVLMYTGVYASVLPAVFAWIVVGLGVGAFAAPTVTSRSRGRRASTPRDAPATAIPEAAPVAA